MVPHLEERLLGCSNEESMAIADLVSVACTHYLLLFKSVSGSERRLECQVGRHEESERCCAGLDNPARCPPEPTPLA
jgi:hypothetical protein